MWLIKIVGLFVPFMKEMPEMMYQYDQDYFFDSTKFEKRFKMTPTSYKDGIKRTISESTR
jgi:nucleoside-diphosphate-sugar epimerase